MLIEIHILQNHTPSNLNRDDTGSPKECIFGGVKRARISSQCLKRSIRRSEVFTSRLEGKLANRTRRLPELVREKLLEAGLDPEMADIAARKASGFGTSEGKEQPKDKNDGTYQTAQTMFLTPADIDAITEVMLDAAKKAGSAAKFDKVSAKDLQSDATLKGYRPISVDVALFGRMITSGAFRNVEACAQVAHAISTHRVDHEFDYFTAVDDLQGLSKDDEDTGADMIGDVEFNSACYYKYFSIDVDGLIANLTGQSAYRQGITEEEVKAAREVTAETIEALLKASVLTTPTGKQNTFAAHQLPAAVLVEVRPYATPVSYANAFVKPVFAKRDS
ncbi:MAG TPA: type I-E CRISPR-associated protein Cas7/Cse4/CasC, partial [Armatimonadota bacterium]|nr:type I-E CRISPR-associated protein Cas7/Cse4/CasC [Armatimonadota bacterium]